MSLLLILTMLFSASIDALAITLNMTVGKNEVVQIQTDNSQFFNVKFQEKEWTPNAEKVYVTYVGEMYDLWRHSGDQNPSKKGSQPWKTSWGTLSDAEMINLMNGKLGNISEFLYGKVPQGVIDYINTGGSWEDIKVTFQCENSEGESLDANLLFVNGAVDGWIKNGTELHFSCKPYFRGAKQMIHDGTSMQVRRGLYPYSHTMFSMFTRADNPKNAVHKGATMVTDKEHGEKNATPGYDQLYFDHIINTKGDLNGGFKYMNIEKLRIPSEDETIDSSKTRIGDGGTFNSGGAIGIRFHFPIKVTFEINPLPGVGEPPEEETPDNQIYVSEFSIANMADEATADKLATNASMQAYSNKEQ